MTDQKSDMFMQLVRIRVQPGKRAEFLRAFRINFDGTRSEPGNIRFDLLCDPDDENCFSIYEIFRDAAALDQHRLTEHYKTSMAIIAPTLAAEVTKVFFAPEMI